MKIETHSQTELTAFSLENNEPAWMTERRIDALQQIENLPLPTIERVKFHRWPLFQVSLAPYLPEVAPVVAFDQMKDTPRIVQQGSLTLFEQLPVALAEKGVIFTDLFSAMKEYPELVQPYFMTKAVPMAENRLTAAHAAYVNSGVFIYIPKNVVLEEPLEALFLQDSDSPQQFFKHVLLVADENSEVQYTEHFQSIGAQNAQASGNIIVEVIAKQGAKVNYAAVDQLGQTMHSYVNRRGYLMKDAQIDWALGLMNDGNVIADFDSDLVGEGAQAKVNVVAISSGRQVQGVDTRVTNQAPHSVGHILQHGVIRDQSTLTFNGIGHILKGAKGADAQQESRVLILSDKARGDANPILLIDENEVTAGHAASVGRMDADELYYLMSRGLKKSEAERLVIRGFLGTVITAMPTRSMQEEFIKVIERKLHT